MPPTFSTSSSTSSAPAEAFWTTPSTNYLVLFGAPWCGHCRSFTSEWATFKARAGASNSPYRHVQVKSVMANNTPQNASLMTYANVSGYPTVYAYRNGKQVAEYTGVSRTAADLERFVKQVFGTVHSPVRGRALGSQRRKDIAGGSRRRRTQTGGARARAVRRTNRQHSRRRRQNRRQQRQNQRTARRQHRQLHQRRQRGGSSSINGMNLFPSGPANVAYPNQSPAAGAPYDVSSPVPPSQQSSSPFQSMPPPPYNGGLYTGPKFQGPWGNLPVTPTAAAYTHDNLKSAQPPPGARVNYPTGATNRPGNSYSAMPGVRHYAKGGEGPNELLCTGCVGGRQRGGGD